MNFTDSKDISKINLMRMQQAVKLQLLDPACDKGKLLPVIKFMDIELSKQDEISPNSSDLISNQKEINILFLNNSNLYMTAHPSPSLKIKEQGVMNVTNLDMKKSKEVQKSDFQDTVDTTSTANIQSLLQQQKDNYVRELEDEQKRHADLTNELAELTILLRESTEIISKTVKEQNKDLDLVQKHAEENVEELDSQRETIKQQSKSQVRSIYSTISLLVFVFVAFLSTYFVIRIFPKPS